MQLSFSRLILKLEKATWKEQIHKNIGFIIVYTSIMYNLITKDYIWFTIRLKIMVKGGKFRKCNIKCLKVGFTERAYTINQTSFRACNV